MDKKLTNEDKGALFLLTASAIQDNLLEEELEKLDMEIESLGIKVPYELTEKIEKQSGLKLKKNGFYIDRIKIAVLIILTFITGTGLLILNPTAVTAVRNIVRSINYTETEKSVEITMDEVVDIGVTVPEGFILAGTKSNKNLERFQYKNGTGSYIEITLYAHGYKLILDNEDFDGIKDIEVNGQWGSLYLKNGIIKIVFTSGGRLVQVESNLSEAETVTVAESINF